MDKVSDTPRTDALQNTACDQTEAAGQVGSTIKQIYDLAQEHLQEAYDHARQLERELGAQKEQFRVLEEEMLVLCDERNAAVLDAKENMEIANEFKKLMEQYRQHAEAAYKQSHKLEEEFKQYRKDHCGCLLKECPDCFETGMK